MQVPLGRWTAVSLMVMWLVLLRGLSTVVAEEGLRRTHQGGGVTIDVAFLAPEGDSKHLRFNLRMNTHSVPLDDYDMRKLSVLRDGRGRVFSAMAWSDPRGGGHHRAGVLVFPAKDQDGNLIVNQESKVIEVIIKGVAGVPERVFHWDLPLIANSR
ncbi:MAG: hypothetical protein ACE5JS_01110 [Nitrospinota bacterium]